MSTEAAVVGKVSREFPFEAERVFDAWLDSKQIGSWMFGPAIREEEIVGLMTEAKVGGRFNFIVRRKGVKFSHIGRYLEIERPTRLVFTWGVKEYSGDNSTVTIEIEPAGASCRLHLSHEMPSPWVDYITQMEASWGRMLDALERSLAATA